MDDLPDHPRGDSARERYTALHHLARDLEAIPSGSAEDDLAAVGRFLDAAAGRQRDPLAVLQDLDARPAVLRLVATIWGALPTRATSSQSRQQRTRPRPQRPPASRRAALRSLVHARPELPP